MKTELEEAANNYSSNKLSKLGFINGAKWQQEQEKITTDDAYNEGFENGKHWQKERMYSEEEVRKAIQLARLCTLDSNTGEFVDLSGLTEVCTYGLKETHSEDSIIEQFKKK